MFTSHTENQFLSQNRKKKLRKLQRGMAIFPSAKINFQRFIEKYLHSKHSCEYANGSV